MKINTLLKITAAIALAAASQQTLRAHSDVKIGPNGGRVLEFSTDQTVHGGGRRKGTACFRSAFWTKT